MGRWTTGARQRLQAAALELFAERGYAATTVAAVAARAGLTERTFFRHFPDKREVLFADDQALVEGLLAAVRDAPDPTDAWDAARRALAAMARELEPRREELRRRARVIAADPDLVERDVVKHDRVVTALARAMQEHGADPARAALAAAVAGAVFRVAYQDWLAAPGEDPAAGGLAAHLERTADDLGRSLSPPR
ncbi:TetR/AcrR family transcriptional regulator [Quadrisphaera sp. DSM 44207]|uniref:TetR/AcrR family transcriptional regulator n=1 Tax=Quadrisphaera sp. DSM 44207 TaxID=1881057 RepID=UPI0008848D81|nr:TetR/AcrR family transcriptional regulator [Quadrisphaera sp. DSM 44207]SDQ67281.1 transcriptional regulator, TetR family [Quadrisphaera sp. DSM 44207]